MFRRCSPIIYTCLPPEIHPHSQNATIIREIINISASPMVQTVNRLYRSTTPNMKSIRAFLEMTGPYNSSRLRTQCSARLKKNTGEYCNPFFFLEKKLDFILFFQNKIFVFSKFGFFYFEKTIKNCIFEKKEIFSKKVC